MSPGAKGALAATRIFKAWEICHCSWAMLWLRAFLSFVSLPGVVAGLVPWLLTRGQAPRHPGWGGAVVGLGVLLLLWCVRDFLVAGRGTLAPWDPPRRLVVVGLYHYVRNPMYVAVLVVLAGWTLLFGSLLVGAYALATAVAFHLRVVRGEEPALRRLFGAEWDAYCETVPRWRPRVVRR